MNLLFHRTQRPHNRMITMAKILHVATSALFLVCGILMITIQNWEASLRFILVGICHLLIGGASILGYFSNDVYRLAFQTDFAMGIFNAIIGVLLVLVPGKLFILPCAIGIMAVMDGACKSQISFEGYQFGLSMWFLVLISALAEIGCGIALIILTVLETPLKVLAGVTMGVVGIVNIWTTMYMVHRSNGAKRPEETIPERSEE